MSAGSAKLSEEEWASFAEFFTNADKAKKGQPLAGDLQDGRKPTTSEASRTQDGGKSSLDLSKVF